jgi:hypothetical protein
MRDSPESSCFERNAVRMCAGVYVRESERSQRTTVRHVPPHELALFRRLHIGALPWKMCRFRFGICIEALREGASPRLMGLRRPRTSISPEMIRESHFRIEEQQLYFGLNGCGA